MRARLFNIDEVQEVSHVFEANGLGKAPFKVVAYTRNVGGTCCDFCSTPIVRVYWIRDASEKAKVFKVGSECVKKTGDHNLIQRVEIEERRERAAAAAEAKEREKERIQNLRDKMENDEEFKNLLRSKEHPYIQFYDQYKKYTLYDHVSSKLNSCWSRHSDLIKLVRQVEKALGIKHKAFRRERTEEFSPDFLEASKYVGNLVSINHDGRQIQGVMLNVRDNMLSRFNYTPHITIEILQLGDANLKTEVNIPFNSHLFNNPNKFRVLD